jgi:valyl-tRNA synthetase
VAEVPISGGSVQLMATDAFDPEVAGRKLAARREKLGAEMERLEKKLANQKFVERAPAEVVEAERAKLAELRAALERLGE